MRFWPLILALAFAMLPENASAQTRRAFIAAVGDYESLSDLPKTLGDAGGYAQVFRDNLKFQVTRAPLNATRAQFNAAFGQFLASIRPGDEVAFVFSGHGWSDGVENFLVLSDASRDASEYELRTETVALAANVLAQISARKPGMTLAIIDACRDNPFENGTKAGFEKGLVRTEVAATTMVVYAAGTRQKALERLSPADTAPYSLFTRVLLPLLSDPARPLMTSVDAARHEVERLAAGVNHQQRPAVYSDISLGFCFAVTCAGSPAGDKDTALWVEVTSNDATCADYERYRRQFPRGKFATQANRILSQAPCAVLPTTPVTAKSAPADDKAGEAFAAARDGRPVAEREFRDCADCPVMVALPTGSFTMGSPAGEAERNSDEGPQRRVTIGDQVAVGKFEVTWNEYERCVSAGRCTAAADDGFGKGSRPVTNVSWDDATAYAAWLSAWTGATYRLLSEAEWEYAARAGTTSAYSFGSSISSSQANHKGAVGATTPVGQYPANAFGLHDMHGNVWEWVEDWYSNSYSAGQPTDGRSFICTFCSSRVYRGGSRANNPHSLRSAVRDAVDPDVRGNDLGFRLARAVAGQN